VSESVKEARSKVADRRPGMVDASAAKHKPQVLTVVDQDDCRVLSATDKFMTSDVPRIAGGARALQGLAEHPLVHGDGCSSSLGRHRGARRRHLTIAAEAATPTSWGCTTRAHVEPATRLNTSRIRATDQEPRG